MNNNDLATKQDVQDIVTHAIKANNEVLVNMFKEEILGIYEQFDKVDKRFETMDRKFEAIDRRFEAVDKRFVEMNGKLEHLSSRMDSVEEKLSDHGQKIDKIQEQITDLHTEITMTASYRSIIKDHEKRIFILEQGMVRDQNRT